MRRLAAATLAFLLGAVASACLWRFWTPRCNEACAPWLVGSMWFTIAALPLVWAVVGFQLAGDSRHRSARALAAIVASVVLVAFLTFVGG